MKTILRSLILSIFLFTVAVVQAQTLETFESQTHSANNFTSAGQNFTLGTGFIVEGSYPGTGWNGTANDNVYLDNSGNSFAGVNVNFSMKSNPANLFYVKSFWVFLSDHALNQAVTGTMTVTGKVAGVTKFSVSSGSGFATSLGTTNGYTLINMTNYGSSNSSNTAIDELDITTTGSYEYMALDALTWCLALSNTTSQTNVACNGGSNGSATVTAAGGVSPYTYSWSPSGGTGATASGLSANTYTCTITDKYGAVSTGVVTLTQPAALTASFGSQTNVSCHGGSNGVATVTAGGGTTTYTYSWTPSGGTGTTASGLIAATYTCTVTDAHACTASKSFTITQPAAIATSISSQTNVSCNGGSNGAATVSASGGTGALSYSWSPSGGSAATASGLSHGTYTCVVTDANACTQNQVVVISQPAALTASIGSQTNVSCHGGSNGAASITAAGGTASYTYSWTSSAGTSATASGLSSGAYTCTITDAHACTTSQVVTITQPAVIATSISSQTNINCNGGTNGAATISASGGTGTLSYSWSPSGGSAATASGLSHGTYTCVVSDANACTQNQVVVISQPAALTASIGSQTNVSCNGGSNGAATITAGGGTSTYTYSWTSSAGTSATATGLSGGAYTCTITDAHACTTSQVVTITQPAVLTASMGTPTNVTCHGSANGSVTVTAGGGTTNYTYSWTPSGGTAATASGLNGGTYTCTVTDANACTASQTATIAEPAALTASMGTPTNVTCHGSANGSVTVTAGGGTTNYTYSWTPSGGTAATASSLSGGTYTCTVTDANACTASQTATITEPGPVVITPAETKPGICTGGTDTLMATGAVTYTWSPAGTLNASSGSTVYATPTTNVTYTVTGTDGSGCTGTSTITVNYNTSPATPVVTSAGNVLSTTATATSYQWYFNGSIIPGATSQNYTATASGNYIVMVTNGSGCSASSASYPFTITGIATYSINEGLKLYPNPSQGDLTLELSNTGTHTEVCIYDITGRQVLNRIVTESRTSLQCSEVPAGMYTYRVIRDQEVIGNGRLIIEK